MLPWQQRLLLQGSHALVKRGDCLILCLLLTAAALLLAPALVRAHAHERRLRCLQRLATLGQALERYRADHGAQPPLARRDGAGRPLLSWRVELLPYLGHEELYRAFRLDEPWDSPHNRALLARMPEVYRCPEEPAAPGATCYLAAVATRCAGAAWPRDPGVRPAGASYTALVAVVNAPAAVAWTRPAEAEAGHVPAACAGHVLYADGSVRRGWTAG